VHTKRKINLRHGDSVSHKVIDCVWVVGWWIDKRWDLRRYLDDLHQQTVRVKITDKKSIQLNWLKMQQPQQILYSKWRLNRSSCSKYITLLSRGTTNFSTGGLFLRIFFTGLSSKSNMSSCAPVSKSDGMTENWLISFSRYARQSCIHWPQNNKACQKNFYNITINFRFNGQCAGKKKTVGCLSPPEDIFCRNVAQVFHEAGCHTTNSVKALKEKINKISPVRGLTDDSLQLTSVLISKSRDTKTRPNIKNLAWTNLDIVP